MDWLRQGLNINHYFRVWKINQGPHVFHYLSITDNPHNCTHGYRSLALVGEHEEMLKGGVIGGGSLGKVRSGLYIEMQRKFSVPILGK